MIHILGREALTVAQPEQPVIRGSASCELVDGRIATTIFSSLEPACRNGPTFSEKGGCHTDPASLPFT